MHLQFLLPLIFSLTALTTLVGGAPTNYATDTQAVTIQRFPLKQVSGQTESDVLQDLNGAMSKFKASSGMKIEHLYLGLVSGDPSVAEQIFLWKSPADASSLDITKPFAQFSSTGTFNHSTAVLNDEPTLLRALNSPITETILADILTEVPTSDIERDISTLVADVRNKGFGVGGSHGIQVVGNTRTIVVVNGWESQQAVNDWIASQDADISAVFERFRQSFVGELTPLFKNLVEIA
ncbi:hypothetical protein L218DRAFT_949307 [Marasmius fiardii PR-910]|nr:hypothetical protein L218DRAFT_949307 [Marasmius fiardii PR-910]